MRGLQSFMLKFGICALLLIGVLSQKVCDDIPADGVYYLTNFCDHETYCGKSCGNCSWGYAADRQRFGCGAVINCVRNGKAMNLEVIDEGPACSLEKKIGKPIIDASNSACKYFTGGTSCGYTDKFAVTCKKISALNTAHLVPRGECTWEVNEVREGLPYCHIEKMSEFYGFQNIEEWLAHTTMLRSEETK